MMASPPAKRQRRLAIVLSDDNESEDEPQLPLRISSNANTRLGHSPADKASDKAQKARSMTNKKKALSKVSPKSSPEKSKQKGKAGKEPERSKSIHTFFGKATEEQRWSRKANTTDQELIAEDFEDDIVDDDSLDEALLALVDGKSPTQDGSHGQKQTSFSAANGISGTQKQLPNSSQRFAKPAISVKRSAASVVRAASLELEEDHRPWSDRFAPINLEELVVNKRKVGDVQRWLEDVLSGRDRRRILVLKGPSGSGKSTTLSLLAKAMGIQLVHWSNPTASEAGSTATVAFQFDEFLHRSGRFESLVMCGEKDKPNIVRPLSQRVLVVEEFPASMTRLESFRSVLLHHLSAGGPIQPAMFGGKRTDTENYPPLVMIITETLLTSSTAATDSFTAQRLLGSELSNHPLVTVMDFNPVAVTFITKALDIVIKKEARESKRRRMPGPAVLQRLAETGDVRSAVNSLEFLCVRGDDTGEWSGTVAAKPKRGRADSVSLTSMERDTLELVSQRESTMGMFHATGKIVHNKREDPRVADTRAEPPPKPPDHLMHLDKPKVSQVDIEALLNESGTDTQTFLSSLHENYVLSCNGNFFTESLDSCAEFLSDSDLLDPVTRRPTRFSRASNQQNYQGGGMEVLRQDEISFQVASRGLLFSLPCPVNRAAHSSGRRMDSFKMFYPASLRLWKLTEEIESLISLFKEQPSGNPTHFASTVNSTSDGVASWGARTSASLDTQNSADTLDANARSYVSHEELTLEVLPYLANIKTARQQNQSILDKITQFRGLHMPDSAAEQEPFDEDHEQTLPPQPQSTSHLAAALTRFGQTQASVDGLRQQRGGGKKVLGTGHGHGNENVTMEKLYLSDDDIQDDD